MKDKVILTCAVTGGDDTAPRFASVPFTPKHIAEEAISACKAGAAIAHIHVRDAETGKPSMALVAYREVVERIRDSGSPVIVNLTTGPGARSNLRTPQERVQHIVELKPDICSLDMGSLNFGKGALINVPAHIEAIAEGIRRAGVKPELEIFDLGHLALALDMVKRGLVDRGAIYQIVLGAPWGAPATTESLAAMKSLLPHDAQWAAFGVGRWEFPMVAQSFLLGGHVRVGLEDNLYLEKGKLAPDNASLVTKARLLIETLGGSLATTFEARDLLGLGPHA